MKKIVLLIINLIWSTHVAGASDENHLNEAFAALVSDEHELAFDRDQALRKLSRTYSETFGALDDHSFQALTTADVRRTFMAAKIGLTHLADPRFVDDMKRAQKLLVSRGVTTIAEDRGMQKALIFARKFEEARRLSKTARSMSGFAIPTITMDTSLTRSARRVLTAREDGSLYMHSIDLPDALQVLAVAHPDCAPSKRSMEDIRMDPELSSTLINHLTWLVPPTMETDISTTLEWVDDTAPTNVHIVYSQADWPELDMSETPAFYIVIGGKVRRVLKGWPKTTGKHRLIGAIEEERNLLLDRQKDD